MRRLVVGQADQFRAQLLQVRQLLSGIAPGGKPCIEVLQGLQHSRQAVARPRRLSETRLGGSVLLFEGLALRRLLLHLPVLQAQLLPLRE